MPYKGHIGLNKGMHGKRPWFYSGFVKKIIRTSENQGFQLARGYSTSRIYNPQLVLFGIECGEDSFSYKERKERSENFLNGIIIKGTVLVTSSDAVAMRDNTPAQSAKLIEYPHQLHPKNIIRQFVGRASVWCYDMPDKLKDFSVMQEEGFSMLDDPYIEEREGKISSGLATDCADMKNGKVVCVLPFQQFLFRDAIIGEAENNQISYALVVPTSVLDSGLNCIYRGHVEKAAAKVLRSDSPNAKKP